MNVYNVEIRWKTLVTKLQWLKIRDFIHLNYSRR